MPVMPTQTSIPANGRSATGTEWASRTFKVQPAEQKQTKSAKREANQTLNTVSQTDTHFFIVVNLLIIEVCFKR